MKLGFDLYYPGSFLKLLLLALGLVALPLVLALVNASFYVEQLAEQSQVLIGQAAQAARGSRQMMEEVTAMERAARQYLILNDTALVGDYESLRKRFQTTFSELSLLPLDDNQLRGLNRTIDKEAELYEKLKSGDITPGARKTLVDGYADLAALAQDVLDSSNTMIDREIEHMRDTSREAQSLLWWRMAIAIVAGVVVALAVSWLVAKPILQIDRAIRALGDGRFDTAIRVTGPADLVYLGDRLEWLRVRLSELEDQKRLFLRHVSHELKTPLTSLREGAELLADGTAGALSPAQTEIVAILRKQGVQLQRQIEELLDYQRAQDSLARHTAVPVSLDRVVRDIIETHRLQAGARGIRVETRMQPVMMRGDPEKLRVIVDNLVSNAIKYSPDNAMVTCVLERDDSEVRLDIVDSGPGIPPQEREKIFEWFFRGEHGHHGRMQGSGLGLAIARDFVNAHRGSIAVLDSARGAHLRVVMPLDGGNGAVQAQASSGQGQAAA